MKPPLKTARPYDYKRLTSLLEPQGFWLHDHPDRVGYTYSGAAVWMRARPDGIFERIICGAGPSAMVNGRIQVVPGSTGVDGLFELFQALELTIKHPVPEQMRAWEDRVAEIVPEICAKTYAQKGAELLASTKGFRTNSLKYLRLCRRHDTVHSLYQHLLSLGPVPAKWMHEAVPFSFIPDSVECFKSAALLMYWHAQEIEHLPGGYRAVNCADKGLRCCSMILASRLANERGWPRTWQEEANL